MYHYWSQNQYLCFICALVKGKEYKHKNNKSIKSPKIIMSRNRLNPDAIK
jgi:hypothetical protein